MTWAEIREKYLAKLFDAMVAAAMAAAVSILLTIAVAAPILALRGVIIVVCK